jgi:hypothetical protein
MTENKTNQTSGDRVAALRTLAFLILGYFSFIIAGIMLLSIFFSFTGLPSKADEPWIFLLLQSALYLGFALTVVPHAWYLYHGVQRRRNLEGPDAGVGVIAPTVAGYIVLVLGPFFGFYASIIRFDSLSTSFIISLLELGTIIPLLFPLLGLTYIFLFYLFIVRKKNDEPPGG